MRVFIALFVLFIAFPCLAQNKTSKPNIILIVADDLGYGDIGYFGQQKIKTPNIDQIAKEGLRFTQFYAGTTVCAPSRASLMTGLHTGHTAVRGNKGTKPEGQFPLPESSVTIANLLQKQGYTTAAFGKWGLGYITTSGAPDKKGFDTFYGYNCQSLAHDYYPDHLWKNHDRVDLSVNLKKDSVYSADLIHQQALAFLKEKRNKPYFAFLPYTLPHGDVVVPHDKVYLNYVKKFNEPPLTKRPTNYNTGDSTLEPYPHAAFAAMISRLDKYVGEIMDVLKANGTLENTLIIFTSDNGPHRENGGDPDFFDSNGPFRGIKRDLYEGGIRVPFIAYWKGVIQPSITEHVTAAWDIYPTLQQLCGMDTTKGIDGISFLPVLMGKGESRNHDYLYWEFHENNGRQAVRMGNWKGVKLEVNKTPAPPMELYNLESDPVEKYDLAKYYPDIVKQLEGIMKKAHVASKDWPLLPGEK